jgi:hypothetical protein
MSQRKAHKNEVVMAVEINFNPLKYTAQQIDVFEDLQADPQPRELNRSDLINIGLRTTSYRRMFEVFLKVDFFGVVGNHLANRTKSMLTKAGFALTPASAKAAAAGGQVLAGKAAKDAVIVTPPVAMDP